MANSMGNMEYDLGSIGAGEAIELDGGDSGMGLYHYRNGLPTTDGMGLAQAPEPAAPVPQQVSAPAPQPAGLALVPQAAASSLGRGVGMALGVGGLTAVGVWGVLRWQGRDEKAIAGAAGGAAAVATLVARWVASRSK